MKEKVYVCGAVGGSGDPSVRVRSFADAARYLSLMGYVAVNPLEGGIVHTRQGHQLKDELSSLLRCDKVYLLRGWERSRSCRLAFEVANACGLGVIYEMEELVQAEVKEQAHHHRCGADWF